MRVLIVEDDELMSRSLQLILGGAGFEHDSVATGEAGLELASQYEYLAILLDLTLPDIHGYEVLRRLRITRVGTPVIILSGNAETDAKVSGLGLGADDYVTKPFYRAELLARIHALVRRSRVQAHSVVVTGPLSVDLETATVEVDGRRVHLTGKEYALLKVLSVRKGGIITKEALLAELYGERDAPHVKIIDVFICKLRRKLSTSGTGTFGCIETVWGRGYALRDPQVERSPRAA